MERIIPHLMCNSYAIRSATEVMWTSLHWSCRWQRSLRFSANKLNYLISVLYGTWKSVTVFTESRHWRLAWGWLSQSLYSHHIRLKSVLILPSSLGLILTKWGLTLTLVRNYSDYHLRHKHRAFSFLWFSGALRKIMKSVISFVMSVRQSAWNNSASAEHVFIQFDVWKFHDNMSRKFSFHYNVTRTTGILHEGLRTLVPISCWILTRIKTFWDEVVDKSKTHILCWIIFF